MRLVAEALASPLTDVSDEAGIGYNETHMPRKGSLVDPSKLVGPS